MNAENIRQNKVEEGVSLNKSKQEINSIFNLYLKI
jgi:hypothetical protein